MRRLLAGAVLILAVSALGVAAQEGKVRILGSGSASCGVWTAARHDKHAGGFEQWVLGYASGVGSGSHASGRQDVNPLLGVDAQGVLAWIDNYCRDHPLEMVVDAANAFVAAHPR
jgi:hypothetical protein